MTDPTPIAAHAEEIDLVVKIILSIAGVLAIWVLNRIDKNQVILFKRMTDLEHEFYQLKGEHNVKKGKCEE